MCSIDETVSFCWISKFSEAPPDAQFIIVFYPPRTNPLSLRVLFQVCNWRPGLKEGNFFLNGLQVYKEYYKTLNSTVCKFKQLLGYQDCLEKVLFKVAWHVNLLKVLVKPSQAGKPASLYRNPFILKNRAASDQHP